jgi:hypothetical protein
LLTEARLSDDRREAMNDEVKLPASAEPISGYREWAAENYPLTEGWNSAVDILLRRAWMDARRAERERCAELCEENSSTEARPIWREAHYYAALQCAAAIRKGE